MSAELARRAETLKLARVLRMEAGQLGYLGAVDPAAIRELRERVSDSLFEADRTQFQRLAGLTKLLPTGLTAVIAEKAFGPLLCARVCGLLPADRAVEIANKLPTNFLAQTCLLVDPQRARELIGSFPIKRTVELARLLAGAGEYVAMGRFVDSMSKEAIGACMEVLDDAQMLNIGFFVEEKSKLDEIVGWLSPQRLRSLIQAGARDAALRPQALSLMSEVSDRWKRRMGDIAIELGEGFAGELARAALEQDLWPALLPVVALVSEANQRRLLALPLLQDEAMLVAILRAADGENLWPALLPLLPLMEAAAKRRIAALAAQLDDEAFPHIAEAARAGGQIPALVGMLGDMDAAQRRRLLALPAFRDENLLLALVQAADAGGLWPQVLPLAPLLDAPTRARLAGLAAKLDDAAVRNIADGALDSGCVPQMMELVRCMSTAQQKRIAALLEPLLAEASASGARPGR